MGANGIKFVRVRGFQALKDVQLRLSPGVNVIVGPSDAGKSSLVRAIKAATQQAEGTSFVREGSKKAAVGIELEDGRKIVWEKGKGVNRYTLDGNKFSRVGRSVPEPVVEVLNMSPAKFGESAERLLQFSEQGESAFMLADPPSECARILGGVSGAAMVADAVRHAAKNVTNLARDMKTAEREAAAATEALCEFEGLDEEREAHHKLYKLAESLLERSTKAGRASEDSGYALKLTDEFGYAIQERDKVKNCLDAFEGLNGLDVMSVSLDLASAALDKLFAASNEYGVDGLEDDSARRALRSFEGYTDIEKRFAAVAEAIEAVKAYREAKNRCRDAQAVADRAEKCVGALEDVGTADVRLSRIRSSLSASAKCAAEAEQHAVDKARCVTVARAVKEAEDGISEFIKENPTCPLCGSSMEGVWV